MKIILLATLSLIIFGCSKPKEKKEKPLYSKIFLSGEISGVVKNIDVKNIALESPIKDLLKNEKKIKIVFSKDSKIEDGVLTESHTYYVTLADGIYTLFKGDARVETGKDISELIERLKKEALLEFEWVNNPRGQ